MASNSIVLKDTTYNGVSSIEVPVSGGGTALFTDVSDTTAAAADVAQGKYFYTAAGAKTQGTAAGGSDADYAAFIMRSTSTPTVPNGVTSIGKYAFYQYTNLTQTSLPDTLTSISDHAFDGCSSLAINSLPSGVTAIGGYAFNGCSSLALTSLPSGVTSIAYNAFYDCSKLALTSLPSGITSIASNAFNGCSSLALTSLPSGVTSIGGNAFQNCKELALTSLPSGVTSIGGNAFYGCTGLTTITCSGQISTFTYGSFNKCSSLTRAEFPNCKVSSFSYAFGSSIAANACQNLETIDIGNSSSIGANAFANCYKLQTLVLRKSASICTLASVSAFLNTPMRGYNSLTGTVYVPNALISSYQTASNWSTLYNNGTLTFAAIEGSPYEL